jgi:hypothetical protein
MKKIHMFYVIVAVLAISLAAVPVYARLSNPLTMISVANSTGCSESAVTGPKIAIYVSNWSPWPFSTQSRDSVANSFYVSEIDVNDYYKGTIIPGYAWVISGMSASLNWSPGNPAIWTYTSSFHPDRLNPIVLPGETTVVLYYGWNCAQLLYGGTLYPGVHHVQVVMTGTYQGHTVTLQSWYTYTETP